MDCLEVKLKIADYLKHSLNQEETASIEEHLCVCNSCREQLSQFMDAQPASPSSKQEPKTEKINTQLTTAKSDTEKIDEVNRTKEYSASAASPNPDNTSLPDLKIDESTLQSKSDNATNNIFDYVILVIGLSILIFFIFLLFKR